jgi:hypothetical protein
MGPPQRQARAVHQQAPCSSVQTERGIARHWQGRPLAGARERQRQPPGLLAARQLAQTVFGRGPMAGLCDRQRSVVMRFTGAPLGTAAPGGVCSGGVHCGRVAEASSCVCRGGGAGGGRASALEADCTAVRRLGPAWHTRHRLVVSPATGIRFVWHTPGFEFASAGGRVDKTIQILVSVLESVCVPLPCKSIACWLGWRNQAAWSSSWIRCWEYDRVCGGGNERWHHTMWATDMLAACMLGACPLISPGNGPDSCIPSHLSPPFLLDLLGADAHIGMLAV